MGTGRAGVTPRRRRRRRRGAEECRAWDEVSGELLLDNPINI
jgi:hypothetical protein